MNTNFLDEDLDMVEVLDHPALFSNGRIPREAVPEGLYAYDLYESCDTGNFCYIAPLVVVNHGGTVLTRQPDVYKRQVVARALELDYDSYSKTDLSAFSDRSEISNWEMCIRDRIRRPRRKWRYIRGRRTARV